MSISFNLHLLIVIGIVLALSFVTGLANAVLLLAKSTLMLTFDNENGTIHD